MSVAFSSSTTVLGWCHHRHLASLDRACIGSVGDGFDGCFMVEVTTEATVRVLPGGDGCGEHGGLPGTGWADHRDHRTQFAQHRHHGRDLAVIETIEELFVDGHGTV